MSLLKYSKTWPSILTKMAVVQLRVDSNGRTYSSIVEPACLTGPTNLVESNPNFRMGHPQIVIQTPGETQMALPDVANVGEVKLSGASVVNHCLCGNVSAGVSVRLEDEDHFRRPFRSESIKIDNWDYIYTEKIGAKALGSNGVSANAEIPCGDHRCITGQAALKASTLRRHYYPEGDWGWMIVFVGMLSIILNHGVQISGPLYLLPAGERFKQSAVNSTEAPEERQADNMLTDSTGQGVDGRLLTKRTVCDGTIENQISNDNGPIAKRRASRMIKRPQRYLNNVNNLLYLD